MAERAPAQVLGVAALAAAAATVGLALVGLVGQGPWPTDTPGLVARAALLAVPAAAWAASRPVREDDAASPTARAWARLRRHPSGVAGLGIVGLLLAAAALAPLLWPLDPDSVDLALRARPPSAAHPLGTDPVGRDLLARLLAGARVSLAVGLVAVALSSSVGTLLGVLAGWYGGWVDRVIGYVVDLLLSVPRLVLLLAIVGLVSPPREGALPLIVGVLGLTGWMGVCRVVRADVLSLRERPFLLAARALGLGEARILLRHVVPNVAGNVVVYAALAVGGAMLAEASLSFLGLGIQPPTSSWGTIVGSGRAQLDAAPWVSASAGVAIALAVVGFNLLGDGLRDALDPRGQGEGGGTGQTP